MPKYPLFFYSDFPAELSSFAVVNPSALNHVC